MTNLINKIEKHKEKIKTLFLTLATAISINYVIGNLSKNPEYKRDCEFYRGYNENKYDGEITYVFDPKKIENRSPFSAPKYNLIGDVDLKNYLELDKRYCFIFEEPRWPWSLGKLIYVEPENSSSSVISESQPKRNVSTKKTF